MAIIAHRFIEAGVSVKFSSFQDGLSYLTKQGFDCERVPAIQVGWSVFSTSKALAELPSILFALRKQVFRELSVIKRFKPDLVLSDSRLSAVIAAALLGIPSITVLNQLRILLPRPTRVPLASFLEDSAAEVLAYFWSLSEKILVPDLPPPYTIAERNISRVRHRGKIRFTGFLFSRPTFDESVLEEIRNSLGLDNGKPVILALLSGPRPTRGIAHQVIEAAKNYASQFNFVVSMGIENGKTHPQRTDWGILFEWCPLRDELMALTDIVLARAGHSVIAQSILFGKPMLLIPIASHSEQMANAARAAELGVAANLTESNIISDFGRQAQHLLTSKIVKGKVMELKSAAERFPGVDLLTKEVMKFL